MPLIGQIHDAFQNGDLPCPFTAAHLKLWMQKKKIVKDDGAEYAAASIEAILSNSDQKNIPTSNKNVKPLSSKVNSNGKREYWF